MSCALLKRLKNKILICILYFTIYHYTLRKIIKLAIAGKVKELVVVHKDRLTRFGFELIEDIIKEYSKGTIKIIKQAPDIEPEIELAKDVLQIMNVFTAKMNGMRKYK